MRIFDTAIRTAALAAIAMVLASQPALAQTAPAPSGAGANLVGGADNPYDDLGITPSEAAGLGTILGGEDLDMAEASVMDHQSPPSNPPVIPTLLEGEPELAQLRDTSTGDSESDTADTGANADADAGDGDDGGMSADEYADHLDENADAWDDLADNAADPADAAEWSQHAKNLRAEAKKARAQAAKDKVRKVALLQQSSANTVGTAINVAVNSSIRAAVNGATEGARMAAHSATRSATVAVRPRVEAPRFVLQAGPTMYRY
jgi:hypothetical protein